MATATKTDERVEAVPVEQEGQTEFERLLARNTKTIQRIDCLSEADLLLLREGFESTIRIASAIKELRTLLTDDLLECIMALQGSPLGFLTDKDRPPKGDSRSGWKPGYTVEVVRDVTIDATIRGFRMTGNEVNIISGKFYAAKEGLSRKVREFKGLTNLRLEAGVPHNTTGGALVEYHASWNVNGESDEIHCVKTDTSDTRIPVKVNSAMGADAILGKAERKMLARVFSRITGSGQYSQDVESDIPTADGGASSSELLDVLRGEMSEAKALTAIADVLQRGGELTNSDFTELDLAGDLQREAIRESRGQRANAEA